MGKKVANRAGKVRGVRGVSFATAKLRERNTMAGIKTKSATADAPAKTKKDKSEKKSSKSDAKHAVKSAKPAKKSKKVVDNEQENGHKSSSANSDVEMADSDSEEQSKAKTQKRKAEDEPTEKKKKSKYETPSEISSKLADMHGK